MDLSLVSKEYLAALGAFLIGLGATVAKIWGSGKERMDFQNVNREALRELIKDLQESFKAALLENKELRNKWNDDLTVWEVERKAQETKEDELLKRAISAESKLEFLTERVRFLESLFVSKNTDTLPPNNPPSSQSP